MTGVVPGSPDAPLDERIAALEARVAAIGARLSTGPQVAGVVDADAFWALEGLAARVPEPGAVFMVGHVVTPGGQVARWQQGAETGICSTTSGTAPSTCSPCSAIPCG